MTKGRVFSLTAVYTMVALAACATSTLQSETIPECGVVDGDGLFVFVGKKLEVTEVPPAPGTIPFDYHFRARYRVIDRLCGDFTKDVIEFDAYDHYGFPQFAKFETVLLYVSRYSGGYYHQKYQFNDVYMTRSDEWASCGDPYRREPHVHRGNIQAVALEFEEPPVFSVADFTEEQIAKWYPPEYYLREGDRVTCMAGATADVLYTIKRLGVLKAREQHR